VHLEVQAHTIRLKNILAVKVVTRCRPIPVLLFQGFCNSMDNLSNGVGVGYRCIQGFGALPTAKCLVSPTEILAQNPTHKLFLRI
jgi:hypothetical protein